MRDGPSWERSLRDHFLSGASPQKAGPADDQAVGQRIAMGYEPLGIGLSTCGSVDVMTPAGTRVALDSCGHSLGFPAVQCPPGRWLGGNIQPHCA
jgi:hypothetical protein